MDETEPIITIKDLPISFTVKYLGFQPAKGLWGMKHTRKPVDILVAQAKSLPPTKMLPIVKLEITTEGLSFIQIASQPNPLKQSFKIETISYGVQDLVYTRVFSMIIVTNFNLIDGNVPFICHSFVCESRNQARQITYALAAAFQDYGKRVKEEGLSVNEKSTKRFAIDLRTPEEQAAISDGETEA